MVWIGGGKRNRGLRTHSGEPLSSKLLCSLTIEYRLLFFAANTYKECGFHLLNERDFSPRVFGPRALLEERPKGEPR